MFKDFKSQKKIFFCKAYKSRYLLPKKKIYKLLYQMQLDYRNLI